MVKTNQIKTTYKEFLLIIITFLGLYMTNTLPPHSLDLFIN